MSDKLGREIRLPHEYEWEAAARWNGEDADGRAYPWDGGFDEEKANTGESGVGQTTAVGLYPTGKNEALNLYDLSGNVWEWCRNKYENPADDEIDDSDDWRVWRGGSWDDYRDDVRAAYRNSSGPGSRLADVGLRVALACRSPSHQ